LRRRAAAALLVFALTVLTLAVLAPRAIALDASPEATSQVRDGYIRVSDELLCYCGCARQTVHECTCSVALDLRTEWEQKLTAGATPEQLIAAYIAEHGEQSRNVPPKTGINLIAWFGPGIAIALAGAATLVLLTIWAARGRARAAASAAETAASGGHGGAAQAAADDRDQQRLERELREFDA